MNENCFFHELASPSEIAELPRYPPKSQIPRHNVVKSAAGWIRRLFGNKIQSFGSFVRSSSTLSNIQTDAVDDENGGFAYRDRQSAVAAAPPTKFCMFALKADYNKYPLLPSPPAPTPPNNSCEGRRARPKLGFSNCYPPQEPLLVSTLLARLRVSVFYASSSSNKDSLWNIRSTCIQIIIQVDSSLLRVLGIFGACPSFSNGPPFSRLKWRRVAISLPQVPFAHRLSSVKTSRYM